MTTTLYRFFAKDGTLLYVGITGRSVRRWVEHANEKTWWTEVASTTVEHHPSRAGALEAERSAIKNELPKYNIVHAPNRTTSASGFWMPDMKTLHWTCDACAGPVGGTGADRGWITINRPRPSDVDLAAWNTYHARCDPDLHGYWIDVERVRTAKDLYRFSDHVAGKTWIDQTDWFGFVAWIVASSRRDRFDGPPPMPSTTPRLPQEIR